jgi:hypothetical protein
MLAISTQMFGAQQKAFATGSANEKRDGDRFLNY